MFKLTTALFAFAAAIVLLAGCGSHTGTPNAEKPDLPAPSSDAAKPQPTLAGSPDTGAPAENTPDAANAPANSSSDPSGASGAEADAGKKNNAGADPEQALQVAANPDSIDVLVNKHFKLPEEYKPDDLVYPDVPFIFEEKIEKRMMRKPAAEALKQMFDAAKEDGVYLAGASAYRSHATQKALFDRYVKQDGLEKARTYSALPGTSEHETGLAIDVSGSDGKCAASDCFAGSKEALWMAEHAPEYGFIIRYPEGKESITGYQYEPWHLRYVGVETAKAIADKQETLEEYLGVVPAANQTKK